LASGAERLERRIQLHNEQRRAQIGRAAVVGIVAGLAAVGFQLAVKYAERGSHWLAQFLPLPVLLLLTGGIGCLAAQITAQYAPEAGGSGIPHIKAVLIHLRVIRPIRLIVVKLVGGLLALGCGMSLGREGPTVQMGAAVGRLTGDVLRIPRRSYGALIAAGSGAGLAAAFNAPLAGFIFVMEELKREMSPITYGTALVASVCSVAVTRYLLGQAPSFHIPNPGSAPLQALLPIAAFGVIAGLAGVAFNKCILATIQIRDQFRIKPWMAGAGVGVLAGFALVYFPQIAGVGHEVTSDLLNGKLIGKNFVLLLLAVFAGKLIFTALSYGTGVPGGIFAPILAMGAFLGYAFGLVMQSVWPGIGFNPAGFGTIGMAAMLSASVRAPLTGVVLIVEMTAEYQLLYALLIGSFMAYATAELLNDEPIYEALLERDLAKMGRVPAEEDEPQIIEFLVEPDSDMDGRRIKDLNMPEGALITGVSRNNRLLVPRGTTQLRQGDMITAVVDGDDMMPSLRLHEMAKAPS
jgi:chloride channel protein, CIC family